MLKNNKELLHKLNDFQFDELYIPSSYGDYPDFNEVFNMFKNKNDKTILYNCYGETVEKN